MDGSFYGCGSAGLEEEYCYLTHVEVDEVFGLVCHVGTKITAYYTVPSWVVFLIKLFFNVCCNVFFYVEFLQCHIGTINSILLHLFVHIGMLDDGFPLGSRHLCLSVQSIMMYQQVILLRIDLNHSIAVRKVQVLDSGEGEGAIVYRDYNIINISNKHTMLLQLLGMIQTIGNIVLIDLEAGIALTAQITKINLTHFRIYQLLNTDNPVSQPKQIDFYIRAPCLYPNNFYQNNHSQKLIVATPINSNQTEILILCDISENSSSSNFLYEIIYYQSNGTISFPRQSYIGAVQFLIPQERDDLVLFKMENGDLFESHRSKNKGLLRPIMEGANTNQNRVYLKQNNVYIITQSSINNITQSTLQILTLKKTHPITTSKIIIFPSSQILFLSFFRSDLMLVTQNQNDQYHLYYKHQKIHLNYSVSRIEVFQKYFVVFEGGCGRWEVYEEDAQGEVVMKRYYYNEVRYQMYARVEIEGEQYLLCEKQEANAFYLRHPGLISTQIAVESSLSLMIDFFESKNNQMVAVSNQQKILFLNLTNSISKNISDAPIFTSSMIALITVSATFMLALFIIYFTYKCYTRNHQRIANRVPQFSQQTIIFEEDPTQICPICLQPVCLARIPCGHYFHPQCINQWLKRREYCPMCRNLTNHKDINIVFYPS